MSFNRSLIVGGAALALAACSAGEESGRSTAKISEIEWALQSSGQTTLGLIEVGYQGDHLKEATFRENGVAAGRMEFRYSGERISGIDVIDAAGDQGSYGWNYDDDRLSSIIWSVPQVVSHEQDFEYDDAAGGRARRVSSTTTWVGSQPSSMVENYDYDDDGRLVEISAIQGTSTWSSEIRYDQDSRIERYTEYVGSDFTSADLSYDDDGRLTLIESNDNDRYELSYDDEGRVEEVMVLSPTSGQTLTVTYRYTPGSVAGMTFTPNLPIAGLIDLRGTAFDQAAFTAMAPPLQVGDVPAPAPPTSCTHDVCDLGAALDGSCSSCAASVCGQDSYCCTTSWDASCVGLAESVCGVSCGGSTSCSHDVCTAGVALDASCDSCTATVCGADSYCCTTSWDDVCVQAAVSQCGIAC